MSRKEILIILLMLCFIISFQAVSAADVDNSNAQDDALIKHNLTSNVSAYSLPDSQDDSLLGSVDAGTFKALKNKTDATTAGQEIILENNYTWTSGTDSGITDGITINHDLTINGKEGYNIVIDAKQHRVFKITNNAHVTLNGITFINGKDSETLANGGSNNSNGELTIWNLEQK